MRRLLCLLASHLVLGTSAAAWAGSLGEFKESYEETAEDREDDDPSSPGQAVIGAVATMADPSSCEGCEASASSDAAGAAWLLGHMPGDHFSLGRSPYRGRGPRWPLSPALVDLPAAYQGAPTDPSAAPDSEAQFFQATMRTGALTTGRLDAAGGELFVKLTTTYSPGLAMSYQLVRELESDEVLSLGYALYEPNIWLHRRFTLAWNAGVVVLGDQDTLSETGATLGAVLEIFPSDPLFLEARVNVHGFSAVGILDARLGAGAFVGSAIAIEAFARRLDIFDGAALMTYGVGMRSYLGL